MSNDRSVLSAQPRKDAGKGSARKLRAQGRIPAVVYGRHLEAPLHVSLDPADISKAIATPHRINTLISMEIDGKGARDVLVKDYQMEPISRAILHADFLAVQENEEVKVEVPVALTGRPEGVVAGGVLAQSRRALEVWALPRSIPEKIEFDVSHLKIAQALHINDVKLPEGVRVKSHVNFTIAVVSAPEHEETPQAAAAAAAAAAPAGGAAAPAAGKKEEPKKEAKK